MQEYRNRIRELREEKHITQVRLSTELGVAQETISIRTRKASSKCLISYEIKQYIRCEHGLHNDEI